MAKVPNGVEKNAYIYNRLSRLNERYRQTYDRQTADDRQTDGQQQTAYVNMSSRSLKTIG